jgi:hypothetical protein
VLAVLGVLAAAGRVPGATPEPPVIEPVAAYDGEEILGTRGPDTLRGTSQDDLLFSFGGDDRIEAGIGHDLVDPGNGEDEVWAGDGDDRIRAFDAMRDVISCGPGDDIAFVDSKDVTSECEEIVEADDHSSPVTPSPPLDSAPDPDGEAAPLVTGTVERDGQPWVCHGPVDLDLVRVRVGPELEGVDAVYLGPYCTGRIGRMEVDTWSGDGIKVQNTGEVAHDLVIESGAVRCHDRTLGYHQDGIQVMGGTNLTFRDVTVSCGGEGVNAALFIARGGSDDRVPTDVVFEGGVLGPGASQTVLLADSLRSGLKNTTVCAGRHASFRLHVEALDAVDHGNDLVDSVDEACRTD